MTPHPDLAAAFRAATEANRRAADLASTHGHEQALALRMTSAWLGRIADEEARALGASQ